MDVDSVVQRCQRVPSADSASKVLNHMQRSEKMLRAGHGLAVDTDIQNRLACAPQPTALYSNPAFSLYKLADRRPLPEPRSALFDICTENFHFALAVDAVKPRMPEGDLGQLISDPVEVKKRQAPYFQLPIGDPTPPTAPETEAKPPDAQPKAPKPKEKKEKKEKEKKEKKDKKEKREKKDKREKGDKKEKKDKEKKRKRSSEAADPG